ncbi:MAG: hypothetical protein H6Q90_6548 [Deltaproteobacteria bacterium]|nr:hypothetical protein [Deltaproteobacteria bacterium]
MPTTELDRAPWEELEHAYAGDRHVERLRADVASALAALGDAGPSPALKALWTNIHHQRTVYEVPSCAVPFLAVVAADPAFDTNHLELVSLIAATLQGSEVFEHPARLHRALLG